MIPGLFKLAVRNTLRRGKKSWITVAGVFVGIAAIVSLVSLGQGLEAGIEQEFEELGSNQVMVMGEVSDQDISVVERARGVDQAVGVYQRTEAVTFRGETRRVTVVGADLDRFDTAFRGLPLRLEDGRKLRSTDRTSAMASINLDSMYEDEIEVRSQLDIEGERFRVQGFYSSGSPQFQNSMIVGLDRVRNIWSVGDELTQVVAVVDSGFSQEEVANNIEEEMRNDRNMQEGDENFEVTTPQDILSSLNSILSIVQGIVVGLASIALLVGSIGIMNTMYMSINERTQEIGAMKAIGASERQIQLLFLMEAGLIGLIGGLIGAGFGILVSEIAVFATADLASITLVRGYGFPLIAGSITFSTLIGFVSGYVPARQASKLDPADALRYE
ncbi:MAG: putative ABC transport system permease protein [Candidatus Nanohaloarchaea archaeon]|jgi:putative ABC transport system permease protein